MFGQSLLSLMKLKAFPLQEFFKFTKILIQGAFTSLVKVKETISYKFLLYSTVFLSITKDRNVKANDMLSYSSLPLTKLGTLPDFGSAKSRSCDLSFMAGSWPGGRNN